MRVNPVLATLRGGGTVVGTFVFEFATHTIARVVNGAGADFVVLDGEHSGHTLEGLRTALGGARGLDVVPMVRVATLDRHAIAGALDAGARGVVVPMIDSAEEARAAVAHARYPPEGRRGYGILLADEHGGDVAGYMAAANREIAVFAQVETAAALDDVEAIAAVEGLDALWVGQYDLTTSLGIPGDFGHPRFEDALDRVVAACRRHGKAAAMSSDSAADLAGLAARGFRCLAYGHDVVVYARALEAGIAEVRAAARS
jgi:2-dehydro-3-deoxyglucarate aldolase/4-hydroxy-2-oxoheptanedioate aldolase